MSDVTFYFDLGSPYAYLAAERIGDLIPEATWQPILLGGLFKVNGRDSWGRRNATTRAEGIAEVERRAQKMGLPAVAWPDGWPSDYLPAMRAATYAFAVGRGREFTLQALRDAFVDGHDLSDAETVFATGERVGIARAELEAGTNDPATKQALRDATDTAHAAGVFGVPTFVVAGEVFWGDDRLEEAAAAAVRKLGEDARDALARASGYLTE
jgi:2-hydroxychromene-2-carboxylate isomerase